MDNNTNKDLRILEMRSIKFKEDMNACNESIKQNPKLYNEYMNIMSVFGLLSILKEKGVDVSDKNIDVSEEMRQVIYDLMHFSIDNGYAERDGNLLKIRIPFSINDYDLLVA